MNMFKSKDPLVESARQAMEKGIRDRAIESEINEAFGVESRKALPNEFHSDYDALLSEAKSCGKIDEALKDKIHKVAKSLYNELPKRKAKIEKATDRAMQGKTPKDWARRQAAVNSVVKEEEQLDELSRNTLKKYEENANSIDERIEDKLSKRKKRKLFDRVDKKMTDVQTKILGRRADIFDHPEDVEKLNSSKHIRHHDRLNRIRGRVDVREDAEIEGLIDHLINEGFSYDEIDSGINDGVFDDFLSENFTEGK